MPPACLPLESLPSRKRAHSPEPESQSGSSQPPSLPCRVPEYNPALPFGLFGFGGPSPFGSSPAGTVRQGNVQSSGQHGAWPKPGLKRARVTVPVTSHCSSPAPRRATGALSPASSGSRLLQKKKKEKPSSSSSRLAKSSRVSDRVESASGWLGANQAQRFIASLLLGPIAPPPSQLAPAPLAPDEAAASARAQQIAHAVRQATVQARLDRDAAAAANHETRQWQAYQRRNPRFVRVEHPKPLERKGRTQAPRWRETVSPLLRQATGWQEGEGRRFGLEMCALEGVLAGMTHV